MSEALAHDITPRATIALWLGNWGTPPDVIRLSVTEIPAQDHSFGTWLTRRRGGENGWQPVKALVPEGANPLSVAVTVSKDILGLEAQSVSDVGIITPEQLPGAVAEPTIVYAFSVAELPHPGPSIELGFFPIGALPEAQLHTHFRGWLGPLMVAAFE